MSNTSQSRLRALLVFGLVALPLLCLAAKEFSMPKVQPAASYASHDYHSKEKVTVALEPYDTADKANIFVVHYHDLDLLPVLLVVTNDSDQPVELSRMKAELVTGDGDKLTPATEDDVYRRVSHPTSSGARLPLPFPTKRVKGGVNNKQFTEIDSAQFKAKAVEPLSSQAGFLFFDISDAKNPLRGSHFYLTGVRDASGNDLMFFDVSLEKSVDANHH
jgi:hypothetical protein